MDKRLLEKLINERLSQPEIAKRTGVSESTVKRWIKKFGLKTRPIYKIKNGNRLKIDWNEVQKTYDDGFSCREIGEIYKISQSTIRNARIEGLLKIRNSKDGFRIFIDKLSEDGRKKHFGHSSNPNKSRGGYREKAGRSKKFYMNDSYGNQVCLQSSYEKRLAEILDLEQIKWIRPKFLRYDDKKYFADFLLVDYQIYLDPKNNFLAKKDKDKIKKVCEQNSVDVFILTKDKICINYIRSLITGL